MAEVTRVPLQPISKGSLTKLWVGIVLAVLLAAGIAWAAAPKGLSVTTLTEGEGPAPTADSVVFVEYVGTLPDGTEFDRSPPSANLPPFIADEIPQGIPMQLQGVVEGFRDGMLQTREGGTYRLEVPAELAYGDSPPPGSPIPANADLTFEVTVHEILTEQEFEQLSQRVQMLMMQQQMQQQGAEMPAPGQ
ncbi:FKBP-type peptidyl-prolyl cis-trans isomerase [Aurantiacibacter poecillastricola]|uniref:FKBP-type peptidyl-prolyl cis-trans isomerase n=1 Tax=Aurantiacibacter poecillastricola TaxID=3064385 RepID=UPI00273CF9E6|nr:FKBP-type peptidyl-prolyl cis-trans isomerase [Aurantiacibacter sp. 219JJ12-13]MDP5262803.1 FKBP-type peptidyl-prolyl cis-trans isomerase [Aurantiacibacter sp. 219JJ12-13]